MSKAGSSEDIRPVVLWICATFPGCSIYGLGACGWSINFLSVP